MKRRRRRRRENLRLMAILLKDVRESQAMTVDSSDLLSSDPNGRYFDNYIMIISCYREKVREQVVR